MKKEEMVAVRLLESIVADIKKIESVEQADRSAVLRKLLYRAVAEWKKEYVGKLYADGVVTLERAAMDSGVSERDDGLLEAEEDTLPI